MLKQLQHLPAWQGSLVHRAIEQFVIPAVQAGHAVDLDELVQKALAMTKRQLTFSHERLYRSEGMTKTAAGSDYAALYDHEYGKAISADQFQAAFDTISKCLRNLCEQEDFMNSLYLGFGHRSELPLGFNLNGASVSALIDLLYFKSPGHPVIVDWKVSLSDAADYEMQFLVYALALLQSGFGSAVQPEAIELYEVNLLKNQIVQYTVTSDRIAQVEDFILKSAADVEALTEGKVYKYQDLEEFEYARSQKSCQNCRFLSLCQEL